LFRTQKAARWLSVPMLALGVGLVVGYCVQLLSMRRRAAMERRAKERVAALEKAD
jgi:hypothetical protein